MKRIDDINFEDLGNLTDRGTAAADKARAAQLAGNLQLESAKGNVYDREFARLERKYGKEHPRTTQMASRIEMNRDHRQAITMEYVAASTPRPSAGEGWIVDGFVRDPDGEPLDGLSVAGYDREDNWYRELGYACTDQRGYFSIVNERLSENLPSPVFMRVSKGKKLLTSTVPQVTPSRGTTDRVEIIVGEIGGKGECTPPQGQAPSKGAPGDKVDPAKQAEKENDARATGDAANRTIEKTLSDIVKILKADRTASTESSSTKASPDSSKPAPGVTKEKPV